MQAFKRLNCIGNKLLHFPRNILATNIKERPLWTTSVNFHRIEELKKTNVSLNLALSEAKKIVNYQQNSYFNLKQYANSCSIDFDHHRQKLVTANHPLLSMIYTNADVQTWDLVVLLVSRAAEHSSEHRHLLDIDTGVLPDQVKLASLVEMVYTGHRMHQTMVNVLPDFSPDVAEAARHGNKVALLCGDLLLATFLEQLATITSPGVYELISQILRDLVELEFIGDRDSQNQPLATAGLSELDWTERNALSAGSLMAKGCQGALMIADHSTTEQQSAYTFGHHLALAWQACLEAEALTNPLPIASVAGGAPSFSLTSAPVIFALQHDAALLAETNKGARSVLDVDYHKLRNLVLQGPGLELTRELQRRHAQRAHQELQEFSVENEASLALYNIALALSN